MQVYGAPTPCSGYLPQVTLLLGPPLLLLGPPLLLQGPPLLLLGPPLLRSAPLAPLSLAGTNGRDSFLQAPVRLVF